METVAVFAALAFTINKIVSVIKAAKNSDWNVVVTQVLVWAVGFFVLALAANADVTSALVLPGFTTTLGELDGSSIVLFALLAGSTGSFAFDLKKAIDGSDSAAETKLLS